MSGESHPDDHVRDTLSRLHDDPEKRIRTLANRNPSAEAIDAQASVFRALGNADRLRILAILREGECCVCELQATLKRPQSTIASHLATLREAGLITARKSGKWTYYRITDTGTLQLLDLATAIGGD